MRSEKALTGTTSSFSRFSRAKPSSISRSRPGLAGSPSKSNISGCSPSAAMTRSAAARLDLGEVDGGGRRTTDHAESGESGGERRTGGSFRGG